MWASILSAYMSAPYASLVPSDPWDRLWVDSCKLTYGCQKRISWKSKQCPNHWAISPALLNAALVLLMSVFILNYSRKIKLTILKFP